MKNILPTTLLIFVIFACNSQKNIPAKEQLPENQIEKILGTKFKCDNNTSNQYKLCFVYETISNVKYVSFAVFDINSNSLIYEQSKVRKVNWVSENEIRVDNFTRMPTGDGTNDYYLYNVKSKEKSSNYNN